RRDALAAAWGGLKAIRSYDGGNGVQPFLSTFQPSDRAIGAVSLYSFKYPPTEVTAGTHDAALRAFFTGIADGHRVYWTYWHAPDHELYVRHSFTPAQYRAAWAHIKAIYRQVKATRPGLTAFATLVIMEYTMRPGVAAGRPLLGANGMYPGDNVI